MTEVSFGYFLDNVCDVLYRTKPSMGTHYELREECSDVICEADSLSILKNQMTATSKLTWMILAHYRIYEIIIRSIILSIMCENIEGI